MRAKDPYGAHRRAGIPLVGGRWCDTEITGDDMAGVIFQDCAFERVRLAGTSFWQAMFVNSRFDDCEFTGCRLFRTQWIDCSGSALRLAGGEFAEAVFSECRFEDLVVETPGDQVVFGSCEIDRVAFRGGGSAQRGLTVSDCAFRSVGAERADWRSATGVAVDFGVWALDGAVFDKCMFVEAKAPGCDFSDLRFDSCNLYRSDFRKARIKHAPRSIFAESDCTGSDFAEADLTGALFAGTLARRARFNGARLGNAMFPDADLEGADFNGAHARESVWSGANLTDADFRGADAYRSTFRGSEFDGAQVAGACFVEAALHGVEAPLTGADLRGARRLAGWRAEREKEVRQARESAVTARSNDRNHRETRN